MIYDQNSFNSNLTSVLAFYANIIIGLDMDSFKEFHGTKYLELASNIVNVSQSSGYKGWGQAEGGNTNRYFLTNSIEKSRSKIVNFEFILMLCLVISL